MNQTQHYSANIDRTERIKEVLELRKPLAKNIQIEIAEIERRIVALEQLEEKRKQLAVKIHRSEVLERLDHLGLVDCTSSLKQKLEKLRKLKDRFARPTLNIGVIGKARQGKSTFLGTLTGLPDSVIPTGRSGACTGVRSKIEHRTTSPLDEVSRHYDAEVLFHSDESFLKNVIWLYYEGLNWEEHKPSTLDNFFNSRLPSEPLDIALKGIYFYLKDNYHSNWQKYRQFLGEQPLRIRQDRIREFVAQYDSDENIQYKHLAVREVKIYCQFPNHDVENIALVDVPGLGDKRLGDEQRLIQTLEQDVDFVVFIRSPEPLGAVIWNDNDINLYRTADASLDNLPNRSFMLLNRVDGDLGNGELCNDFAEQMEKSHIKVSSCLIKNCTMNDEVVSALDDVLFYLARNIRKLDNQCRKC